jgi:hypothetical protein
MILYTREERILNYPNNVLGFEAVGPADMFVFTFLEVWLCSSNNKHFLVSLLVRFSRRYFNPYPANVENMVSSNRC